MHIPDGFLTPPVWGATDVVSAAFVVVGVRKLSRDLEERAVPLMGVLAAFVFAAQMINLPVAGGTSAHFLGGGLVGSLLGPWAGLVVMTVVLVVQSVVFQDGGIAALGANVLNMAVLGSLVAGILYKASLHVVAASQRFFWAGLVAGACSVLLSALGCAGLLVLSHVVAPKLAFGMIGGVHLGLGILEGIVTGTVLQSIARTRPDLLERSKV